jgi:hypothetical protein
MAQQKKALGSSLRQRERFHRLFARLKATRVRGMGYFSLTSAENADPSQCSEMFSRINYRTMRNVTSENSAAALCIGSLEEARNPSSTRLTPATLREGLSILHDAADVGKDGVAVDMVLKK